MNLRQKTHAARVNILEPKIFLLKLKTPFNTTQKTECVSTTNTHGLVLYREVGIIAFCSAKQIKHINRPCGQTVEVCNVQTGGAYKNSCA